MPGFLLKPDGGFLSHGAVGGIGVGDLIRTMQHVVGHVLSVFVDVLAVEVVGDEHARVAPNCGIPLGDSG